MTGEYLCSCRGAAVPHDVNDPFLIEADTWIARCPLLAIGSNNTMQTLLRVLLTGLLVFWTSRFALGLIRGEVKGTHPGYKRLAWIARAELPGHFWTFTLLQIILLLVLAWLILGLWNTRAF